MSNMPYNGYSWAQRMKIIPAFRKLTGKDAPFDGEPCSICGDRERAPGEWHSEDYSEPYSFEPPESYPVCKSCHMRLHKRFNAPPGEWALFCLHLDAGGYGAEFAKLRTPPVRRELCERLVRGDHVDLPAIRFRRIQDDWWRHLTLDPESLEAPWARPRPLRQRPDTEQFLAALTALGPSEKQRRLLKAHASAPRRTASMRALALEALGKNEPATANLIYGTLAHRLTERLNFKPDQRDDGSPVWMSIIAEGWYPPRREFEWTMVPSLRDAILAL
ncbi:hypothetical protein GCM10007908_33910 [Rhizobium albus]|nr:hypothetical protein GCM10007908_33910 [Rhizobium albus]